MSDTPKTDAFEALVNRPTNWWDFARELERENAALRADIHAHEQINKQLIEDKRRLDWLLTDDGGFWVNWMYDKDEWMPELKASRDAIDACRNGRIGREKP